jgi:hypothetical protein
MAGDMEGNTCCKHKQKLPPPAGGKWQPKQEEWWLSREEAKLTHLHLEDILLAHRNTTSNATTNARDERPQIWCPELSNQV